MNQTTLLRIAEALERIADVLEFDRDRAAAQRKVDQIARNEPGGRAGAIVLHPHR